MPLQNMQAHALPARFDGQTQDSGTGLAHGGSGPQQNAQAFTLPGQQLQTPQAGGVHGVRPAENGSTAVMPEYLFGSPKGVDRGGRLQPQETFGGQLPMRPGLHTRRMGRFDQSNAALGKLPGQGRAKELKFAAARALKQDFDQLTDRPTLAWQGLVES